MFAVCGIQDSAGGTEDQWLSEQHRVPGVILYTTGHHGRDEDIVRKPAWRGRNQVQGVLNKVKKKNSDSVGLGACVYPLFVSVGSHVLNKNRTFTHLGLFGFI